MAHVQYAYAGKQFIRYMLAKKPQSPAIILYGGWPGEISNKPLMEFLVSEGFHVFSPVYPGLYQSHGEFLAGNIIDEQEAFFEMLRSGKIDNLYLDEKQVFNITKTHVFGSSFGGSIALGVSSEYDVDKTVLFAPVWDWREQEGLDEELTFAKRAFKNVYRLATDDLQKSLMRIKQLQPKYYQEKIISKILVFHDPQDEIVPYNQTTQASKHLTLDIRQHTLGHSMSDPLQKYWREISSFLNNHE